MHYLSVNGTTYIMDSYFNEQHRKMQYFCSLANSHDLLYKVEKPSVRLSVCTFFGGLYLGRGCMD